MSTTSSKLIAVLALGSITLLRVPFYIGNQLWAHGLVLVPFVLAIGWALPRLRPGVIRHSGAVMLAAYVALIAIALWRGVMVDAYTGTTVGVFTDFATYGVVAIFAATLLASADTPEDRSLRVAAVALAPAAYVAVNALLHIGGAVSPSFLDPTTRSAAAGGSTQLLALVGIDATRVQFPLAQSVNNFGVVAAAGLAACVVIGLRARGAWRAIYAAGAAVSLYGVVLCDSRGPLLVAIGVMVLLGVFRRVRAATTALPVVLLASPAIVVASLGVLAGTGSLGGLARSGSDFGSANNRLFIWQGAWDILSHPSLSQLFGWGAAGQITSGAAVRYAYVFVGSADPTSAPLHNIVLQTIFDSGYVGLAVLVVVLSMAIRFLQQEFAAAPSSAASGLLAGLLVVLLSGMTEVVPTYYSPEALMFVLLVLGVAMQMPARRPEPARLPAASARRSRPSTVSPH